MDDQKYSPDTEASDQLAMYIRAGCAVIFMHTSEESRAESEIKLLVDNHFSKGDARRELFVWSNTEGIRTPEEEPPIPPQNSDPVAALNFFYRDVHESSILIMHDLHHFFKVPVISRRLRDAARDFKQKRKTIIIVSPVASIPPELERDILMFDYKLPGSDRLAEQWDILYKNTKTRKNFMPINSDERERIVQAARGLTTDEAENAFAKAIVQAHNATDPIKISTLVMKEKALAVRKSGLLEYLETPETLDDIGGMQVLKEWSRVREKAFSLKAREFGLPSPKGIVLVGPPGCGKSLAAKALSGVFGVPLIKFEMSRVLAGLVGESERNMRSALAQIDAVGNAVVWIDEMEKAFAGVVSGGSHDSGVSSRVFGTFITWMQEKSGPAFIAAAVNRREGMPPELMRKGRFDEIFYVGLPDEQAREEIFKIHLAKFSRSSTHPNRMQLIDEDGDPTFSLDDLIKKTDQFSGAEIEEAIKSAMYTAFDRLAVDGMDKVQNHFEFFLARAIDNTVPLYKSQREELDKMSEWAKKYAIDANGAKHSSKANGRTVDVD